MCCKSLICKDRFYFTAVLFGCYFTAIWILLHRCSYPQSQLNQQLIAGFHITAFLPSRAEKIAFYQQLINRVINRVINISLSDQNVCWSEFIAHGLCVGMGNFL